MKTLRPKTVKERAEKVLLELEELEKATRTWADGMSDAHLCLTLATSSIRDLLKFFAETATKKQS